MMKGISISSPHRQQGSALIFALMALVVLSLAAVGLVRSVNTGALIAGNLSFKRDTTLSAASGAEQAISWLQTQLTTGGSSALDNDNPQYAYFASAKDNMDATGNATSSARPMQVVNWDGNCQGLPSSSYSSCDVIPYASTTKVNGNSVQWVITRLCDFDGPYPTNPKGVNLCTKPPATTSTGVHEKGRITGKRIVTTVSTPYYRVVTRVEGPRNTVSYVETIVHF